MGLLRSEAMKHGTLVLPVDRARAFMDVIGEKTNMQFEDMNARNLHMPYKTYIQRLDEMERILRFLGDELSRVPGAHVVKDNLEDFLAHASDYKLDDVEAALKRIHVDFVKFQDNNTNLVANHNAALEELYVVKTAAAHIGQRSNSRARDEDSFEYDATRSLLAEQDTRRNGETMFSNVAGVIPQDEQDRFARALFRATRGNTFVHFQEIQEPMQDPKSGKALQKSVFVIYFQDQRSQALSAMADRVTKICHCSSVNIYAWPATAEAAETRQAQLQAQVLDQELLLKAHESFVLEAAQALIAAPRPTSNSLIEDWRLFCLKEKAIYASLNMFEGHMNLRANCWYPAAEEDQIRAFLIQHGSNVHGSSSAMLVSDRIAPRQTPPTYIRTNEFTTAMQTLIDLYGLPRYQEANPVVLGLVTFPFLFGVMYGDVGHGTMLFLFGLFLVFKADDFKKIPLLYHGRYMITMMGFFGIYAGFMYNDLFSVGMDLFGSRFTHREVDEAGKAVHIYEPAYDSKNMGGVGPYPFGLDPAWHGAANELVFVNSLKMKISVVLGVTQMIAGLFLRFANAVHERNMVDFFCECCPMMVFMVCFFGFMDYMILYKWVTPMANPPSIINSMIAMGMWQEDPYPMFGIGIVRQLMMATMITVPLMLFPKPIIQYYMHSAEHQNGGGHGGDGGVMDAEGSAHGGGKSGDAEATGEEHNFGEMMIHQVIETIEYVLGTVSHTASYLRLWALSLAHQQLALVFFEKTILPGMAAPWPSNVFMMFVCFAVWFGITCAVLMGMDVLECFMHTLRLHWVEFQSKFYKADGYQFVPYRHRDILEEHSGEK
jgi:V-type H+-transporting ATPase subunit a